MIKLSEIINQTVLVEAFGTPQYAVLDDAGTESFQRSKLNTIIGMINTALSDINDRMPLEKVYLTINTTPTILTYKLVESNTIANGGFIVEDSFKPVSGVLSVYSEDNIPLRFNTVDKALDKFRHYRESYDHQELVKPECSRGAIELLSYDTIHLPKDIEASTIRVAVATGIVPLALVPVDQLNDVNLDEIQIDIPYQFLMAIVYYTASRMRSHFGSSQIGQTQFNQSKEFYNSYIQEIARLLTTPIVQAEIAEVDHLARQGFC